MPFVEDDKLKMNLRKATADMVETQGDADLSEQMMAAFRTENSIGSLIVKKGGLPDGYADTDFNPYSHFSESEKLDDDFISGAVYADSLGELENYRAQVGRERTDRAKLTGWTGFASSMVMGTADPINFIPVGGTAVKTYRTGGSILKNAAITSSVAGGSAAITELALHSTQLERTGEESMYNVTGALLLGGLIGGGSASISNKLNKQVIDEIEKSLDVDSDIAPNVIRGDAPDGDLSAAATWGDVRVKGAATQKILKALSVIDPLARGMTARSKMARKLTSRLSENPLEVEGAPIGQAVEQRAKARTDALYVRGTMAHRDIQSQMKADGVKMPRREFNKLVAREMRNPGSTGNKYAEQSAAMWRKEVYDPIAKDLKELGLLDPDVEVKTAANYLNRRWNKEVVAGRFDEFVEITSRWLSTKQEFDDIGDAVELAKQIGYRIMGTPDGVLRYDTADIGVPSGSGGNKSGLRAPFKARKFEIPDELVEEFLDNDIEEVARIYLRHTVADAELVREFGDTKTAPQEALTMKTYMDDIKKEYADLAAEKGLTEKERKAIKAEGDKVLAAIDGMLQRIRGIYDLPQGKSMGVRRFNAAMRNLNYVRLMGGVVASSIPDIGKIIASEGFMRAFGDGFAPMVKSLRGMSPARKDIRYHGIGAETITSGRIEAVADISDYALGGTKLEKGLEYLTNHFGNISLINQWNDIMKTTHALAMQARVYDDLAAGKYDSRLSKLGLTEQDAQDIFAMVKKHGSKDQSGARLFNAKAWENQELAFKWAAALRKESDRVIIVPGQEKPLFMSQDLGKTLLQFRSFMLSSTQRTLLAAGQGQEANLLGGMLTMISLGAFTYAFKQWDAGRPISDDPMVWVTEGIDRSGALGILMETSNTLEKISGNRVGLRGLLGVAEPASRFASRSEYEAMLGPTYGSTMPLILRAMTAGLDEHEWKESDTRALRRLLPYQNLTFLRRGVDAAEKYVQEEIIE